MKHLISSVTALQIPLIPCTAVRPYTHKAPACLHAENLSAATDLDKGGGLCFQELSTICSVIGTQRATGALLLVIVR